MGIGHRVTVAQTYMTTDEAIRHPKSELADRIEESESLTVMSYNIYRGMEKDTSDNKTVYTDWLKKIGVDILAIQETAKTTQQSLLEQAEAYNHPYAEILSENEYSIALTSKYPIKNVRRFHKDLHHGLLMADIGDYTIMVTHLSPFTYKKRHQEIETILEIVRNEKKKEGLIFLGDFNSVSRLDSTLYTESDRYLRNMKMLAKKYSSHDNLINGEKLDFEVHNKIVNFPFTDVLHWKNTDYLIARPGRIDFIYVSNDLKNEIKEAKFVFDEFTKYYSDHFPLLMTLQTGDGSGKDK